MLYLKINANSNAIARLTLDRAIIFAVQNKRFIRIKDFIR
jgi:hypothetical protein|tara:strand:- start:256 stop:375 length:120 start_codon:yes stop_codon:yes gene_type:complete